jgi:hypothetical protein
MNAPDVVERLLGHSKIMERDKGKFVRFIDVATCAEAVDLITALTAERDAAVAELARLQMPSGYWRSEDREFGYPDLNDLLDGYERDGPIQITPWRDLPDGFAAWAEDRGWVFCDTEADAIAAGAHKEPSHDD